jgi:hypothetical protein
MPIIPSYRPINAHELNMANRFLVKRFRQSVLSFSSNNPQPDNGSSVAGKNQQMASI